MCVWKIFSLTNPSYFAFCLVSSRCHYLMTHHSTLHRHGHRIGRHRKERNATLQYNTTQHIVMRHSIPFHFPIIIPFPLSHPPQKRDNHSPQHHQHQGKVEHKLWLIPNIAQHKKLPKPNQSSSLFLIPHQRFIHPRSRAEGKKKKKLLFREWEREEGSEEF